MNILHTTITEKAGGDCPPPTCSTLYAKRDAEALGQYYIRHVAAMTSEGLHAKCDIAAELAHRDRQIDQLRTDRRKSWQVEGRTIKTR